MFDDLTSHFFIYIAGNAFVAIRFAFPIHAVFLPMDFAHPPRRTIIEHVMTPLDGTDRI